ncbi:MAG TPA: hypothetical protein VG994_18360 [Steroidobacteraceae bacterium]|nr:hypothetical protein [Steroidobacteraceae bacterium]
MGNSHPQVIAGAAALALCAAFIAGANGTAPRDHALLGEWRFDPSASRFDGGIPYTRATSRFTATAACTQVVVEIVEGNDRHIRFEYCDPGDGSDAPVTGNPFYDAESTVWPTRYIAVRTEKRHGVVTGTTMMSVAEDGKTYTATASRKRPDGIQYNSTIVWRRVEPR